MRGSRARHIPPKGVVLGLVVESTLSSAELCYCRKGHGEAALRGCMRKPTSLGKLIDDQRPPDLPVGSVHCSQGLSLRHRVLGLGRLG